MTSVQSACIAFTTLADFSKRGTSKDPGALTAVPSVFHLFWPSVLGLGAAVLAALQSQSKEQVNDASLPIVLSGLLGGVAAVLALFRSSWSCSYAVLALAVAWAQEGCACHYLWLALGASFVMWAFPRWAPHPVHSAVLISLFGSQLFGGSSSSVAQVSAAFTVAVGAFEMHRGWRGCWLSAVTLIPSAVVGLHGFFPRCCLSPWLAAAVYGDVTVMCLFEWASLAVIVASAAFSYDIVPASASAPNGKRDESPSCRLISFLMSVGGTLVVAAFASNSGDKSHYVAAVTLGVASFIVWHGLVQPSRFQYPSVEHARWFSLFALVTFQLLTHSTTKWDMLFSAAQGFAATTLVFSLLFWLILRDGPFFANGARMVLVDILALIAVFSLGAVYLLPLASELPVQEVTAKVWTLPYVSQAAEFVSWKAFASSYLHWLGLPEASVQWTVFILVVTTYQILIAHNVSSIAPAQLMGDVVVSGRGNRNEAALTIDGIPTEADLEMLAGEGISATVFVTSIDLKGRPDAVEALASAGHEVGLLLTEEEAFNADDRVIKALKDQIEDLVALPCRWARTIDGARDYATLRAVNKAGMTLAMWTAWVRSWDVQPFYDELGGWGLPKGLAGSIIRVCFESKVVFGAEVGNPSESLHMALSHLKISKCSINVLSDVVLHRGFELEA
jgi:hypothetical protein